MADWLNIYTLEEIDQYGHDLTARADNAKLFHTGIYDWDKLCDDTGGGLDDFWYVPIAGASNVGKTQIILALARRAVRQGFAAIVLTMEEPRDQIQRRIYSAESTRLSYYDFTYDKWQYDNHLILAEDIHRAKRSEKLEMFVNDDLERYDLQSIIGYIEEARAQTEKPCVVFVDNLQLVHSDDGNVAASATAVSEGLRKWAKQTRTLTFALSQLTAQAIREGVAPRCYHMWGGSTMYSNASQVLVLDHTAKTTDAREPWIIRLWGLLDKNRYGPAVRAFPIEANLKTGEWRSADPDVHHLWNHNPWEKKK